MPAPRTYPNDESVYTPTRVRVAARDAAEKYAAKRDTTVARVMADALELFLAAQVDRFEPVLTVQESRQLPLDNAA